MVSKVSTVGLGHPVDRSLRSLEHVQRSIEAQLEFEYQLTKRDQREISLAKCFPQGKLILRGGLDGFTPTIDPEVSRTYLIQDGRVKGILYVNMLRKTCIAVDWLL